MFGGWTGPPDRSWDDKKNAGAGEEEFFDLAKTSKQLLCLDTETMSVPANI